MNFYLKPNSSTYKDLYITEWAWMPVRSLMAIANHIEQLETGKTLISYQLLSQMDDNAGNGIQDPDTCKKLALRLRQLINTPEIIEDYGMTVDLIDGGFVFTYPSALCTSAMQHKHTKTIINAMGRDKPENLCSMLRATEEEAMQVVNFLENCDGFLMP